MVFDTNLRGDRLDQGWLLCLCYLLCSVNNAYSTLCLYLHDKNALMALVSCVLP